MNVKKIGVYSILILMVLPIFLTSVFADGTPEDIIAQDRGFSGAQDLYFSGVSKFIGGIEAVGGQIFRPLLGSSAGDNPITGILVFFLVMFVVYGILSAVNIFGEKPWINMVIGALVAIIGIRFIPSGFLESAAMPSSAFVLILLMGIPFILLFFILQKVNNSIVRRVVWAGFAVINIILWINNAANNSDRLGYGLWIYPAIAAASLIALWFDGTLQRFLRKGKAKRVIEAYSGENKSILISRAKELSTAISQSRHNDERDELQKQYDAIMATLKKMK